MRKIEQTVLQFSELNDSAQRRALDKLRYINLHDDCLGWAIDAWKEELGKLGFEKCEIRYEIESRFEFVSFGAAEIDCLKVFDAVNAENQNGFDILRRFFENGDITIHTIQHPYWHDRWKLIISLDNSEEIESDTYIETAEPLLPVFEERCRLYHYNLCEQILAELKTHHEYLYSDEAVRETIDINEYEFFENGDLYK